MNLEINQDNLYLLLPAKVSGVARIYASANGCSVLEAMRLFYKSELYQSLEKEETKLWQLGNVALYEMWTQQ